MGNNTREIQEETIKKTKSFHSRFMASERLIFEEDWFLLSSTNFSLWIICSLASLFQVTILNYQITLFEQQETFIYSISINWRTGMSGATR